MNSEKILYRLWDTSTNERVCIFESYELYEVFCSAYGLDDFEITGGSLHINFLKFRESCFFSTDTDLCFHLLVKEMLTDKEINKYKKLMRIF